MDLINRVLRAFVRLHGNEFPHKLIDRTFYGGRFDTLGRAGRVCFGTCCAGVAREEDVQAQFWALHPLDREVNYKEH